MRKNIVRALIALSCFIAVFAGVFYWGAGSLTMPGDKTPDVFPIVVHLPASHPPVFELGARVSGRYRGRTKAIA